MSVQIQIKKEVMFQNGWTREIHETPTRWREDEWGDPQEIKGFKYFKWIKDEKALNTIDDIQGDFLLGFKGEYNQDLVERLLEVLTSPYQLK